MAEVKKTKLEKLTIPGKKGPFYCRHFTSNGLAEYLRAAAGMDSADQYKTLIASSVVKGNGAPVYKLDELDKVEKDFGAVNVFVWGRKISEINDLERLAESFQDLEGKIKDAEKNSESGQS